MACNKKPQTGETDGCWEGEEQRGGRREQLDWSRGPGRPGGNQPGGVPSARQRESGGEHTQGTARQPGMTPNRGGSLPVGSPHAGAGGCVLLPTAKYVSYVSRFCMFCLRFMLPFCKFYGTFPPSDCHGDPARPFTEIPARPLTETPYPP